MIQLQANKGNKKMKYVQYIVLGLVESHKYCVIEVYLISTGLNQGQCSYCTINIDIRAITLSVFNVQRKLSMLDITI